MIWLRFSRLQNKKRVAGLGMDKTTAWMTDAPDEDTARRVIELFNNCNRNSNARCVTLRNEIAIRIHGLV